MDKREQLEKMKSYMKKRFNITPENIDKELMELKQVYIKNGLIK